MPIQNLSPVSPMEKAVEQFRLSDKHGGQWDGQSALAVQPTLNVN